MLGSTPRDLPSDSPAACRSACRRRQASPRTGSLPTNDPRAHPACPGRPRGRAGHRPTTSHDDGQVQTETSAGPAPPAPASSARPPTQADDEPGMDAAGDHADPGHLSRTAACPAPRSTTSLRPDTADAATHKHRTPTPDAGQRTPGRSDARTGHWTPVPSGGKRGHWSLAPDTGRGRGQGDEGAAGIPTSWATTPSDHALGRPTMFLWTAPAALDNSCSSAVRPPSSAR
jgi:hypothetical protein